MKVQIKTAIKNRVAPILATYGFHPDPSLPAVHGYLFTRTVDDVQHMIVFDKKTIPPQTLELFLNTSVDIAGITGAGLKRDLQYRQWPYHDQSSLEAALQEMVQVVVEVGLRWLEVASIPIPKAPPEIEQALFASHSERAQAFADQHGLSFSDPEALCKMEDVLNLAEHNPSVPNWDLSLAVSAFFGHYVLHHLKGNWEWEEQNQRTRLRGMGGKPLMKSEVLSVIVLYEYRRPFSSLQNTWLSIQNAALSPYHYV